MTGIYTARIAYRGDDRLDITRKSAGPDGIAFAPSWKLLGPVLAARRHGDPIEPLWPAYVEGYTAEMRASYRGNFPAWGRLLDFLLLKAGEVTFCCYCTDARYCHRTVLAEIMRSGFGATVCGERVL